MRRALLVLEVVDDLVGPEGRSAGAGYSAQVALRRVLERIRAAVAHEREQGGLVIWVALGFSLGYLDWPAASPLFGGAEAAGAFEVGSAGAAPLYGLGRQFGDPVVVKPRVSPFFGTRLEVMLRTQGVREVVLCGVATEHVVLAAARDAHDRDLQVTVLTDAVESSTDALHDAGLAVMASYTRQRSTSAWVTTVSRQA